MDTKIEAMKYLNKYFKSQYINENDDEYKSLVRLLNKAQKRVKNCSIPAVMKSVCNDDHNPDSDRDPVYRENGYFRTT